MKWLLAVCALTACRATAAPNLELIDLTDEIARSWDRSGGRPDAERVAAFKAEMAPLLPGFYDNQRMEGVTQAQYDAHLARQLPKAAGRRADVAAVSSRFATMLAPALASFEAVFGPMTGYPPVYLVDSLGEMDGGTRDLPQGVRLIFGADMIARLYPGMNIRPFFHHELFHLYHARTFPECDRIWCSLWAEGLAVHVAATLNPGASDTELSLDQPEPLAPAYAHNPSLAICAVLERLDSANGADYRALFSSDQLNDQLSPRFGYYVGYVVARELGRERSVLQLAQLTPAEVRPLIEQYLREQGSCQSPQI